MLAAVALVACKKDGKKQDEVPSPDTITLLSEEVVNVGEDSEIITVKFSSNVNWTADATDEFIVLKEKAGNAGENIELKATIQSLPEGKIGRLGGIYIEGGDAERVYVVIMQGKVFFIMPEELSVGVEGGKAEFKVVTNLDYEVKIYDSFDWAPATFDKETGKGYFTVAANDGYDARSAYVKFTIPDIQDQAYDDGGAPIEGETVDHVERIYVDQAGLAEIAWKTYLPEDFNVTSVEGIDATATIALFNGKLLVSDATKIYTVDPATGAFNGTLEVGTLPVQSIANDDAGNPMPGPALTALTRWPPVAMCSTTVSCPQFTVDSQRMKAYRTPPTGLSSTARPTKPDTMSGIPRQASPTADGSRLLRVRAICGSPTAASSSLPAQA